MKFTLILLLWVGHSISSAQTRYALRQIDFQDDVNSELVRSHTDNLAVILVDAYLNGKLQAYKVGPLDSLIQGIEFPKRSVRAELSPAKKKRAEKKKLFRSNGGVEVTIADLKPLSKSEFLEQMVVFEEEVVQWDKNTRFERGHGLVYHKGLGYFPKKDTVGIPPPNKTFWELAYNANLPYYFRIPDLPAISIFGQYVTENKKETWQPILVRVTRTAEAQDVLVDMSVSFKYNEVIRYLSTIGQPLLYKTSTGYIGNANFVLDDDARNGLKEQIRTLAKSSETFRGNITVSSTILFNDFLTKPDENGSYQLYQDPAGKELRLIKNIVTVAVIPSGAVEQALSFPKVGTLTYASALTGDVFNKHELRLSGLTSELPYTEVSSPEAAPRATFFLVKYLINTTGASEQKRVQSRFNNLIKLVNAQFKAGTLMLAEEKDSYFRARYDWSTLPEIKAKGTTLNKTYWSNLLHHDDISDVRYPYYWSTNSNVGYLHKKLVTLRADSLEFGVTYKRIIGLNGKSSFQPLQVSLRSTGNPGSGDDKPTYTFNFADLKKAINKGKDPLLVELVKLIETGSLPYSQAKLVYGLIQDESAKQPVTKK